MMMSEIQKLFRTAILCGVVAATAACAPTHYVTKETPQYDPTVSARMRILTGNDMQSASFQPGSCYSDRSQIDDPRRVDVDDGFWARYKYSSRSITIGMPPSPRPGMRVEGLNFKDMIREYVIPAGKPIVLTMANGGDDGRFHWYCSVLGTTFMPIAGQDYDVFLNVEPDGRHTLRCWIEIREIDSHGLDEPVRPIGRSPKCALPPTPSAPRSEL